MGYLRAGCRYGGSRRGCSLRREMESFRRRLDALPAGSRQLMLVAGGADPVGDAALVRQAAARLGIAARPATSYRSRAPRPVRCGLARRSVRRGCERDAGRMRMAGLPSVGRPMTASPQEHVRVQLVRHSHRARFRTIPLPLLRLRPLRGPPLLPGRLLPGQVIRARRHRGVPAVPRPRPLRRGQLLPQASDHRLQRRDPLRLLPDQRITRILRRHIGHSPGSSPKPRSATTATPRLPPKRNRRSRTAAASPRT